MKLIPVFVDYETFWSQTHSLSKMNHITYARHPETEVISCAIKIGPGETRVVFGEDCVGDYLRTIDWSNKLLIAHNNEGFDAMISAWRYGIRPAMWGCTLAMARPHYSKTQVRMPNGKLETGCGLGKLSVELGIGQKNNAALMNTRGKHLKDFTPEEVLNMMAYNNEDTELLARLFLRLLPMTPNREMRLIDHTIRMLVEPMFETDTVLLEHELVQERTRKRQALLDLADALDIDISEAATDDAIIDNMRGMLASSAKFAAFLSFRGVDVPMKPSPTNPEKQTYALAKTDEAFLALQQHHDPVVAMAASTRLHVKSTILESRIESFLEVSRACGGKLPVALRYYGADTTGRWSGSMNLNQQNLPRIPRDRHGNIIPKPTNALRLSMRAPKGYMVVVADLSGIELRVNHFLWKTPYSMKLWGEDPEADLYRAAGALWYGCAPEEITKDQRHLEKIKALGLGFGAGATTFREVAKLMGGIDLTEDASASAVMSWRGMHPEIVRGWKICHAALDAIDQGAEFAIDPWGMCVTTPEGIRTPRGVICYPALRKEVDPESGRIEWWYGEGRHKARIYAGKVTENIVQHLARNILADYALEIEKVTGRVEQLGVHDELVYVVPEAEAEQHLDIVQGVMRTPPTWWPELVTWSEGDVANSYGTAK